MEAAIEKQEGLAAYTGVFIALRKTGESISREARIVEGFEDNAYARSFAYTIGPALGLLLDRYAPGCVNTVSGLLVLRFSAWDGGLLCC
jgi:hypothetical protein